MLQCKISSPLLLPLVPFRASIPNILNLLWCLWKARNDNLFNRKCCKPHHLNAVVTALNNFSYLALPVPAPLVSSQASTAQTNQLVAGLPVQGITISSGLLISGPKVFADAAFHCAKIPLAKIFIQASAPSTCPPLETEALAAEQLNLMCPPSLSDRLSLTMMAATRNIRDSL